MEDEITQLGIIIVYKALLDELNIKYVVNSFTTETNINEFLTFYQTELPTARVTPKLHMLEAHVIPWIHCWGVGIGFHNEQGAESIHTRFNSLKRIYSNIRNPVDHLKGIMNDILTKCSSEYCSQASDQKEEKKYVAIVVLNLYLTYFTSLGHIYMPKNTYSTKSCLIYQDNTNLGLSALKKKSRTLSGPVICTSSIHAPAQHKSPGKIQQQSCAS